MGGLGEGCKKPYNQQVGCIIKLARMETKFSTTTAHEREKKIRKGVGLLGQAILVQVHSQNTTKTE